jgi:TrkA family protein
VTSLILVLAVIALSLLVTRVAGIMLALTGMSRESARFQARSAFTGVGFTTDEAESVTSHPIRRRIVLALMLLGSAGVVTAAASLIVSFGGTSGGQRASRALVLLGGIVLLLLLSRSRVVDNALARLTTRLMHARGLDVRDYAGLLQLEGGYRVGELEVEEGDWVAGRVLGELRLRDEGVIVLGIHRPSGDYIGVPGKATTIEAGDSLVVYGVERRLEELDERHRGTAGDRAHREAVEVG